MVPVAMIFSQQNVIMTIWHSYREDQVHALHNPVYTGAELQNESLSAEYSIPVPNYEVVSPTSENSLLPTTEQHAYDVISQQQRQAKVASQSDESEVYSQLQH